VRQLKFLVDQNMDDRVRDLLNGRGHPTVSAREVGLSDAGDADLIEYALSRDLVIVTFDNDFRRHVVRQEARCLFIRRPERTARARTTLH